MSLCIGKHRTVFPTLQLVDVTFKFSGFEHFTQFVSYCTVVKGEYLVVWEV
jgi:hypothetical protein